MAALLLFHVLMHDHAPASLAFDDEDTIRATAPSLAEVTLDAVLSALENVEPSPHAREFLARANRYKSALASRVTQPPTAQQRETLRQLVTDLHEELLASARCAMVTSRPPSSRRA